MAPEPVPSGALRLTLKGNPTADQSLRAARLMLRILRDLERNMRAAGELPPGPPIQWQLSISNDDEPEGGDNDADR